MVGGPIVNGQEDYAHFPFNLATLGHRQPGSSFKPFTLAEALLQFGEGWRIDPADSLIQALRDQFGRENVFLQYR